MRTTTKTRNRMCLYELRARPCVPRVRREDPVPDADAEMVDFSYASPPPREVPWWLARLLVPLLPLFFAVEAFCLLRSLWFLAVTDRAKTREKRMHRRKAKSLPPALRRRYLRSVGLSE